MGSSRRKRPQASVFTPINAIHNDLFAGKDGTMLPGASPVPGVPVGPGVPAGSAGGPGVPTIPGVPGYSGADGDTNLAQSPSKDNDDNVQYSPVGSNNTSLNNSPTPYNNNNNANNEVNKDDEDDNRNGITDEEEAFEIHAAPDTRNKTMVVNNYFSVGIDSKVLLDFHNMRNNHPGLFASQFVNLAWYGGIGLKAMVEPYSTLKKVVSVMVDGEPLRIRKSIKAIVLLNIPSYGGGTNPWVSKMKDKSVQSIADGYIELVGLKGSAHIDAIQAKMASGVRLGQARVVEFCIYKPVHGQADGEPFFVGPAVLRFDLFNRANMLFNSVGDPKDKKRQKLIGNGIRPGTLPHKEEPTTTTTSLATSPISKRATPRKGKDKKG